jgi:hypothetical protein
MSFQPVIALVEIPRTNDSFEVIDDTDDSPAYAQGWGAANAPANLAAITSIYSQLQPYGEDVVQIVPTGNLTDGLESAVDIRDGVNTLGVYYGKSLTVSVTAISDDRKTLTLNSSIVDHLAVLANVYAIDVDGTNFPVRIRSLSATTLELYEALPDTAVVYSTLYVYWLATYMTLVLNQAEGRIAKLIAAVPIKAKTCEAADEAAHAVHLKLAAEAAFANGDYAKAHEAARLITSDLTYPTSNCATCE